MGEEIRRQLQQCLGESVVIFTKLDSKICGRLSWLSPDRCMAEVTLKSGQIETILDVRIKSIKRV